MKSQNQTTKETSGIIYPNALYTLVAFKTCLGISDALIREARREGFRVHRRNGRAFILGSDWIAYVTAEKGNE